MHGKDLIIFTATLAMALALVPVASAQVPATGETESRVRADVPSAAIEAGSRTSVFIFWNVCYTGPAVNPNNGAFTATMEVTGAPTWLTVTADPQEHTLTPPHPYLAQAEECLGEVSWELTPDVVASAPPDTAGDIMAVVHVAAGADMGSFGTQAAGDFPVTLSLRTAIPPDDGLPGATDGTNNTAGPGDENGESPGLVPVLTVLVLVAVVALRRRQ